MQMPSMIVDRRMNARIRSTGSTLDCAIKGHASPSTSKLSITQIKEANVSPLLVLPQHAKDPGILIHDISPAS
jgi:hypothetical protein